MSNEFGSVKDDSKVKYTLHCGKLSYNVTEKAKDYIDGLIYWQHCENMERREKTPDEHALEECRLSIKDMMDACEKLGVPNWVGNGAIQFANDNNLKSHYISEFYESSKYSEKAFKKAEMKQADMERN